MKQTKVGPLLFNLNHTQYTLHINAKSTDITSKDTRQAYTVLDNMALKLMDNLWIQENLQMIIKYQ